jgi:hypothetical protein
MNGWMGGQMDGYLELIKYCAIPTDSGVPVIVTSLSDPFPSLLAIFIIAPELTLISCILLPFLPITHPIKSFGILICCTVVPGCVPRLL